MKIPRYFKTWYGVLTLVLTCAAGSFAALWIFADHAAEKRLGAILEKQKAQGIPMTIEDLEVLLPKPIKGESNAYDFFLDLADDNNPIMQRMDAFENLISEREEVSGLIVSQGMSDEDYAFYETQFSDPLIVSAIEEVLGLGEYYFYKYDFSEDFELLMPEIAPVQRVSRLLSRNIEYEVERRRRLKESVSIENIYHKVGKLFIISQYFENSATLVGQFLRVSLRSLALERFFDVHRAFGMPKEIEKRFSSHLHFDYIEPLRLSLDIERVIGGEMIRRTLDDDADELREFNIEIPLCENGYINDVLNCLPYYCFIPGLKNAHARFLEDHFGIREFDSVEGNEYLAMLEAGIHNTEFKIEEIFSATAIEAINTVINQFKSHEAYARLARLGLAVGAYEYNQGKYPQNLEELVPSYIDAIPTDPWSNEGKPLMYKKMDTGFSLYSIGENKVDDGGFFDFEEFNGPDIPFRGRGGVYHEVPIPEKRWGCLCRRKLSFIPSGFLNGPQKKATLCCVAFFSKEKPVPATD